MALKDFEPPFGVENIMSPTSGVVQTNSNNFFKVGGTRTPVGSMFQGRGVSAPRFPRVNTADSYYDSSRYAGAGGLAGLSQASNDPLKLRDPNKVAEDWANWLEGLLNPPPTTPTTPTPTPSAPNPYNNAIKTLQQRLGSGEYGTSFDNLSTMLGTTATGAGQRIDDATASALAGLRSSDPMAAYQFNAPTTQIPQTALNTYLNSIGASTSSVDAGRQLLQGMIDAQTASAGQYSAGAQQGFDLQRQAAQDALTGNQQYAQSQLALARQAQEMAIAQAKERERKAIEDQILEYVLRGGQA
jgi:hypothetical protein